MLNLTPFLLFDGNCAEAMTFYQSCFSGELTLTKLKDTPMKDQMPPEKHNKITYASLKSGAIEFSATDWLHPTQTPKQGNTVCMYVNGGRYSELRMIFDKLSSEANKRTSRRIARYAFWDLRASCGQIWRSLVFSGREKYRMTRSFPFPAKR
jgi:PhnB protein